jgi:hypothetical protein
MSDPKDKATKQDSLPFPPTQSIPSNIVACGTRGGDALVIQRANTLALTGDFRGRG